MGVVFGAVFGGGPSVGWMWDIPAQRGARHRPVLSPGLTETCRDCGQRSLDYLGQLKDKQTLGRAELGDVRRALRGVLGLAQVGTGAQHSPGQGDLVAGGLAEGEAKAGG